MKQWVGQDRGDKHKGDRHREKQIYIYIERERYRVRDRQTGKARRRMYASK